MCNDEIGIIEHDGRTDGRTEGTEGRKRGRNSHIAKDLNKQHTTYNITQHPQT